VQATAWVVAVVALIATLGAGLPALSGAVSHLTDAAQAPGHGDPSGPRRATTSDFSFVNSTWTTYPTPPNYPGPVDPGLASDPVNDVMVLFGGCAELNCSTGTNETWTGTAAGWKIVPGNLAPSPRYQAQMAWDPADGYVLLFGGFGCLDPPVCDRTGALNDTWAFKDGTWNPVVPSGSSPPPTVQGGLAFDPSDGVMVLYGGLGCSAACATWEYAGGTWTELNLTTQPSPRYAEGLAADDAENGALLFGGENASGAYLSDTWLFSHGGWTVLPVSAPPEARAHPAMTWDATFGAVVMSGGEAGPQQPDLFNDTYEFVGDRWQGWDDKQLNPGPVHQMGATVDPSTGLLVLFGGCLSSDCSRPTWAFGPVYSVEGFVESGTCASLTVNGALLGVPGTDGNPISLHNGTYPLTVAACPGFQITNLTATGLLVTNASSQNETAWVGSLNVSGAGTLLVNLTRVATNPGPTGLAAISVLGLTFLELLLIGVALGASVALFVAMRVTSRKKGGRRSRDRPRRAERPPEF
jgi:hypothetical protein